MIQKMLPLIYYSRFFVYVYLVPFPILCYVISSKALLHRLAQRDEDVTFG